MTYDEIWAVPFNRIEDYFRETGADVRIVSLPDRRIGSFSFPQTRIIITGENADEVYRQFRIRFLSAGG
ncbi:MAG: DUF1952 domain-containing protein [Oscillospiraceae bacterium]|nr:DUF1952 domain-containing protein [Oscillospiraceae bacterium]